MEQNKDLAVVIDCGTTNTRLYLADRSRRILARVSEKVGVRDTAITGSADRLRTALGELYRDLLAQAGASSASVRYAVAAGMITSEIGLMELPHLTAPCALEQLAAGAAVAPGALIPHLDVPLLLVRGVKNPGEEAGLSGLGGMDFMRGEEAQCMGVLALVPPPLCVLVLSSHTKLIRIGPDGAIQGSVTTMSGQVYEAVKSATFLGASLSGGDGGGGVLRHEDILEAALDAVDRYGLTRGLLMTRFLQVLLHTTAADWRDFLECLIASDDVRALSAFLGEGAAAPFVILGQPRRAALYRELLLRLAGPGTAVTCVTEPEEIAGITVGGALRIAEHRLNCGEEKKPCIE